MSKGLEEIRNPIGCTLNTGNGAIKYKYGEEQVKVIEQELKDYEWLKSVISIDMFDQLPTPEDKIRFLKIMGVEL